MRSLGDEVDEVETTRLADIPRRIDGEVVKADTGQRPVVRDSPRHPPEIFAAVAPIGRFEPAEGVRIGGEVEDADEDGTHTGPQHVFATTLHGEQSNRER